MADVVVELLTRAHDRNTFDCGRPNQNELLKQRARKHAEIGYSKTWVAVESGQKKILGFVTFSMGSVAFADLDPAGIVKLPRYPMPVLHVGQLATDVVYQGKGVGSVLLGFAIRKAIELSHTVGCYAIELIADNEQAYAYYIRRGFIPMPSGSRLYLPVTTLAHAALKLG